MLEKERNITNIVYLLQALSFIFGITAVAAVIINYIKIEDVRGTWLDSHFRWQIRTDGICKRLPPDAGSG